MFGFKVNDPMLKMGMNFILPMAKTQVEGMKPAARVQLYAALADCLDRLSTVEGVNQEPFLSGARNILKEVFGEEVVDQAQALRAEEIARQTEVVQAAPQEQQGTFHEAPEVAAAGEPEQIAERISGELSSVTP